MKIKKFRQVFWLIPPSQHLPTPPSMQWLIVRILRELQQRVLSPIYTAFPHWLNLFLAPKPDTKIEDYLIAWLAFNIKIRETFLSRWYRKFSKTENFFLILTQEVFCFHSSFFQKTDISQGVYPLLQLQKWEIIFFCSIQNQRNISAF